MKRFYFSSVVNDLQNGKRVVFAVGPVNSKMTLFISGPGGKSDVAAGCTVQMDENKDGVFKITDPPAKMPNGVSNADVIFVCVDKSGSLLMTMSSGSVGAVKLPDGGSSARLGNIHLSSSESLYYYTVSSSGEICNKIFSSKNSITSSEKCYDQGHTSKLCVNGDKITVKKDCQGSSISNLVSGYVGGSTAYLFGSDNTVYVFDASAFTSGQKVASKDAWKGSGNDQSSSKPEPKRRDHQRHLHLHHNYRGALRSRLLLIFLCIIVYCCFFRDGGGKNGKKKEGGPAASGKKEKSKKSSKKKSTMSKGSSSASKKASSAAGSPKKKKGSKGSKGKGSAGGSRRSSTKLPKKSASRKMAAPSGRT
ncbi:hypothetical protein TYRP_005607 [Tyrophagus putrescentiae]|nr:hypothetical protein TYRP_005607 [Tyrophagus putrescentiae]